MSKKEGSIKCFGVLDITDPKSYYVFYFDPKLFNRAKKNYSSDLTDIAL